MKDNGVNHFAIAVMAVLLAFAAAAALAQGTKSTPSELPPGSPALMQPQELLKTLQSSQHKPLILYVGPRFLYAQKHIPGAEFVGPASDAQSLDRLRQRVASLAKSSPLVLYCGCCPWEHCPNIRPAYKELRKLGFTNTKALYLANSFGVDWVDKGYPVEKGETR